MNGAVRYKYMQCSGLFGIASNSWKTTTPPIWWFINWFFALLFVPMRLRMYCAYTRRCPAPCMVHFHRGDLLEGWIEYEISNYSSVSIRLSWVIALSASSISSLWSERKFILEIAEVIPISLYLKGLNTIVVCGTLFTVAVLCALIVFCYNPNKWKPEERSLSVKFDLKKYLALVSVEMLWHTYIRIIYILWKLNEKVIEFKLIFRLLLLVDQPICVIRIQIMDLLHWN